MGHLTPLRSTMPDSPVLDPQAIADLRALSPDDDGALFNELVEIFLRDTPLRLRDIEVALAAGDAIGASRAAHSIKGSGANFGAVRLTAVALQLEQLGKAGDLAALPPLRAALDAEFDQVRLALEALVRGP
jgi:histidine phosphotransfer protein HptB